MLDILRKLQALKVPQRLMIPILEIIEGGEPTRKRRGKKRRKRRTKAQMAKDAAKAKDK